MRDEKRMIRRFVMDFLRDHNCDLIQGFCAGQPLTEDDFIDFYRNGYSRQHVP